MEYLAKTSGLQKLLPYVVNKQYNTIQATFSHAQAGIRTQAVVRDSYTARGGGGGGALGYLGGAHTFVIKIKKYP